MQQQIDDSLRQEKLLVTLSCFFGGVPLLPAMIGLYGALSYRVAQRHKDIGIRLALGARQSSVQRPILKDVSVVLLAGVAAGLGASWWAMRFLRTMLFDLNPHDARIIVLAFGALLAIGFLAGFFPARRATRVDPIVALRFNELWFCDHRDPKSAMGRDDQPDSLGREPSGAVMHQAPYGLDGRQPLPWDRVRIARHPPEIDGARQWNLRPPIAPTQRVDRWHLENSLSTPQNMAFSCIDMYFATLISKRSILSVF